ncbi:MAG: DUF429 domain-containing protein, partial [Bdellovibrionales bacterium]
MPRARVRSTRRKSRPLEKSKSTVKKSAELQSFPDFGLPTVKSPKFHRFIGLSLGGGKTDKTALSVIEYYPAQKKIFLSRLFDKIQSEGETSADLLIHRMITQSPHPAESISFDVPIQLPKCLTCKHRFKCPGYEACDEPEIEWMWKHYRAQKKKKSPPKLFTPYTERCVEQFLQTELEEPFHLQHALGSNLAPLTARAQFIQNRLGRGYNMLEVFPKLSLWRIGSALHMTKTQLRFHRHWDEGQTNRQAVITKMMDKNLAFIYDQDVKTLVDSPQSFDSFLCALTGLLSFLGHCEARPKGFPRSESWIEIPKKHFVW